MKPDLKALYHPLILRHSKAPVRYIKNEGGGTTLGRLQSAV